MLQGRTFSYSDTQRHRVGANYLQLPINAPKKRVATNQRDGQMAYHVDTPPSHNPHINYEPSVEGLKEAERNGKPHEPEVSGRVVKAPIDRPNNFGQAGETYKRLSDWEKDELIKNLVAGISQADSRVQKQMVHNFTEANEEYGRRVKEGLEKAAAGESREKSAVEEAQELSEPSSPY